MDLRKEFLAYFEKKDHLVLPSSGLIPKNDPSVLLTTAGMQQFKPYYLGTEKPPSSRICTVQKCFRTSDIESVGYTERHLTFFEMLGNFSFGDYFKKEAIEFALKFITGVLKIPLGRLSAGVFEGDAGIPADEESIKLWIKNGINPEKIYRYGKKENFWGPAGDTGPCGPCTEIYYDFGVSHGCGREDCSPSCECGRFMEIWNLVFTQYNFDGKKYSELPDKNIDTGMGLERIAAVLEGSPSVFKTPLFKDIVQKIEEISGKEFNIKKTDENSREVNRAIRILADHSRAIYFLISDGVTPSNEGRGYILRRIIRRAIRFGKILGIDDYFLNRIGIQILEQYGSYYPGLVDKKEFSFKVVSDEEERFTKTLEEGVSILLDKIRQEKSRGNNFFDPQDAFRLYDTFGFPVELTVEILKENGLSLNMKKFSEYLNRHVEKSKKKTAFDKKITEDPGLYKKIQHEAPVEFEGFYKDNLFSKVTGLLKTGDDGKKEIAGKLSAGEKGEIILGVTPFYAEKGGQAGDSGIIKGGHGIFEVNDSQAPMEGIIIHRGVIKEGVIKEGEEVEAVVDRRRRIDIRRNHTATHLLHWALRQVFGDEVKQSGSFVTNSYFRFDYTIFRPPSKGQLEKVERMVNEKIIKNDTVKCFETTREYANELGAVALFEEKYGSYVRVVEIDNYSRELCGGIHSKRTGELGLFKIISDSSIGANLRRIEAETGIYAYESMVEREHILEKISGSLETEATGTPEKIIDLKNKIQSIKEELDSIKIKMVTDIILQDGVHKISSDFKIISFNISCDNNIPEIDIGLMGQVIDRIKDYYGNNNLFIILGHIIKNKPVIVLGCSKDLVDRGIRCGELAGEIAPIVGGGGGGRPDFAQLGGSLPEKLNEALKSAVKKTENLMGDKN
ncbi:MAG: alanine--tRNA ligase [Actinobacteria bacterium]|nr:alanine--tRNA ligase [Actinomycetota bacterium]